jgi:hypothetical protein
MNSAFVAFLFLCSILCFGQDEGSASPVPAISRKPELNGPELSTGKSANHERGEGTVISWNRVPFPTHGNQTFLRRIGEGLEIHVQDRSSYRIHTLGGEGVKRIETDQPFRPPFYGFTSQRIVWSSSEILDYSSSPAHSVYRTSDSQLISLIDIGDGALAISKHGSALSFLCFDRNFRIDRVVPIEAKIGSGPGNDVLHYPELKEIQIISSLGSLYRYGYRGRLIQKVSAPGGSGPNYSFSHSQIESSGLFFLASTEKKRVFVYESTNGDLLYSNRYDLMSSFDKLGDMSGICIQICADKKWLFYTGNNRPSIYGQYLHNRAVSWGQRIPNLPNGFCQTLPPLIWRDFVVFPCGNSIFLLDKESGSIRFRLAPTSKEEEKGTLEPSQEFYMKHLDDFFFADDICFIGRKIYVVGHPREKYPSVYFWEIPSGK